MFPFIRARKLEARILRVVHSLLNEEAGWTLTPFGLSRPYAGGTLSLEPNLFAIVIQHEPTNSAKDTSCMTARFFRAGRLRRHMRLVRTQKLSVVFFGS
jgi:hypothetical protein